MTLDQTLAKVRDLLTDTFKDADKREWSALRIGSAEISPNKHTNEITLVLTMSTLKKKGEK